MSPKHALSIARDRLRGYLPIVTRDRILHDLLDELRGLRADLAAERREQGRTA